MADYETLKKVVGFEECKFERFDEYYYYLFNELNQSSDMLLAINNLKKNKNNKGITYKDIKNNIKIFDALGLKLRDVNVTSLESYDMVDECTYDFEDVTSKKHPSNIPLFLVDTKMLYQEYDPAYSEMEITTVKSLNGDGRELSYISMGLEKNCPYTAGSFYNHEIARTQIDSIKGSYRDYFNSDVIPIFIELLTAKYNNNEDLIHLIRMYSLSNSLTEAMYYMVSKDRKIENYKNIYSTLKAIKLYVLYVQASEQEKKNIINYIQSVFDGDLTVESLIDAYDIDESNSRLVIKALAR